MLIFPRRRPPGLRFLKSLIRRFSQTCRSALLPLREFLGRHWSQIAFFRSVSQDNQEPYLDDEEFLARIAKAREEIKAGQFVDLDDLPD